MAVPTVSDFVIFETVPNRAFADASKPANLANGDYWVISASSDGDIVYTWPTGFTEIAQDGISGAGGATGGAAWKEITDAASEPATVRIDHNGNEKTQCVSFRLVGAAATDPVDAVGLVGATNSATYTIPGLTTTVADCVLVAFVASDADVLPYTEDTGWTQLAEGTGSEAGTSSFNVASKEKATAGAEAAADWSQGAAQEAVRFMVAFAPAAGASTFTGTAAVTEGADESAASGTHTPPTFTATATPTEGGDTSTASGTFTAASFTGTAAPTEGADTSTASGTFVPGTVTGTSAVTEGADESAASGTFVPGTLTGTAAAVEGPDTSTASGTFVAPDITGTAAIAEGADTATASGTVVNPEVDHDGQPGGADTEPSGSTAPSTGVSLRADLVVTGVSSADPNTGKSAATPATSGSKA